MWELIHLISISTNVSTQELDGDQLFLVWQNEDLYDINGLIFSVLSNINKLEIFFVISLFFLL